jgi:hypothetical protein
MKSNLSTLIVLGTGFAAALTASGAAAHDAYAFASRQIHCEITTGDGDASPVTVQASDDFAFETSGTLTYGRETYMFYSRPAAGSNVYISIAKSRDFVISGENSVSFFDATSPDSLAVRCAK